MRRTERTGGRTSVQANKGSERTSGRADGRAKERTGRWTGRRADGGGRADKRTEAGGRADGWTGQRTSGQVSRLADWRTGGRQISEGKTLDLTHQLTWPWEIQRGRPRVTVKLPHLPPPSQ